ncbi:HAD hydrolase family protein [archaeon]|nr:HAD hydrolase family protein [archaeon]
MAEIKLVVLDLDGTVVKYNTGQWHSSWDVLASVSGKMEIYNKNAHYYYPKRELYHEWMRKSAQLLRGCRVSDVEKVIFPPPYVDGVKDTLDFLKKRNCVCGILSSGADIVADRAKKDLSLDFAVANRLIVKDGIFSGDSELIVSLWRKEKNLIGLCRKFGVSLKDTLFIGDNDNDISSMRSCGHSIAFSPANDEVKGAADVSFESWWGIKEHLEKSILS